MSGSGVGEGRGPIVVRLTAIEASLKQLVDSHKSLTRWLVFGLIAASLGRVGLEYLLGILSKGQP